jgi:hypothetical protein
MIAVWKKNKIWLLIGLLYVGYYAMRSTRVFKRIAIPRIKWGEKS